MAKTYTALTSIATGDVLTATNYNNLQTNSNNFRVPPMCSLYRNGALSHTSSGNYQSISWDTELFTNTDSMYSAGSATRITLNTAGLYLVNANVSFSANATGVRAVQFRKDGTAAGAGVTTNNLGAGTGVYVNLSGVIQSTGSNYVEVFAYQISGGNLAYEIFTPYTMAFSAIWLGQVS